MGQHTLVAISHDRAHRIKDDQTFGQRLTTAIFARHNPNIPEKVSTVHDVQLGPQFGASESCLVSINDGMIERLTVDEQIYLQEALARLRKKKLKEATPFPLV